GEDVYPLRFGKISSFESEGREFAQENIVNTWLSNSASNSKNILEQKKTKIEKQQEIKKAEQKLKEYHSALVREKALQEKQKSLKEDLKALNLISDYNQYFKEIALDYNFYQDLSAKNKNILENKEQLFKTEAEIESLKIEVEKYQIKHQKLALLIKEIKNYNLLLENNKLDFKSWLQQQIRFEYQKYSLDYQSLPQNLLPAAEEFTLKIVWSALKEELQQELESIAEQRQQLELLAANHSALKLTAELLNSFLLKLEEGFRRAEETKMSALAFKYGNQNQLEQFFEFEKGKIVEVAAGSYRRISSYLNRMLQEEKEEKIWYQLKITLFKLEKSIEQLKEDLTRSKGFKDAPWEYLNDKIIEILIKNLKIYQNSLQAELDKAQKLTKQQAEKLSSLKSKKKQLEKKIAVLKNKLQHPLKLKELINLQKKLRPELSSLEKLYQQLIDLMEQGEAGDWQQQFKLTENKLNEKLKTKNLKEGEIENAAAQTKTKLAAVETKIEGLQSELQSFQSEWEEIRSQLSYYQNEVKEMTAEELNSLIERVESDFISFDSDLKYIKRYDSLITQWAEDVENKKIKRASLLDYYLNKVNIVGTTCSKAASAKFFNQFERFDYVIIDEVSKATIPELLMPIIKAEKVILIGDDKQLPPLVSQDIIEKLEAKSAPLTKEMLLGSYFKKLWQKADSAVKVMLNQQYRMHSDIMAVINQFYQGQLINGVAREAQSRSHGLELEYLKEDQHAVWVQTPSVPDWEEEKVGTSYKNTNEIKLIDQILADIEQESEANHSLEQDIGIITFYRPQFDLLRNKLMSKYQNLNLRMGTVDRFQGMESDIIIVSMVRNNRDSNIGFARTFERINVALSRARKLLILVGNTQLFCRDNRDQNSKEVYQNIAAIIDQKEGLIDVSEVIYR
ncbi:MAG: DEAD/DEAH box helicase, partial [bacterium]